MDFITWILAAVLFISITNGANVNDPFAAAQSPCSQVSMPQFVCVDCKTVGYCSQINGAWLTFIVGECSGANFFCNVDSKMCTYSQQCELDYNGPKFQCQIPGIFPDPYNCKYYHTCSQSNELTTSVCSNGLGYSLQSGTCSLSKSSKECTEPQYKCEQLGQMGSWPSDDNIFYICVIQPGQVTYVPLLYRCPVGQMFSGTSCIPKNDDTKTCDTFSLIADPSDCTAYYGCNESILQQYWCSKGTHFDATKESCVLGECK